MLSAVRAARCNLLGIAVNYALIPQQYVRAVANGEASNSIFRHINSKQGVFYIRLRANVVRMAYILNRN
jgi:hypothetical protein